MVYATASLSLFPEKEDLANIGFKDSKVLAEADREALRLPSPSESDWIGWSMYVNSPRYSKECYVENKFNLNEMSIHARSEKYWNQV
jgi:ribonuclease HII